MGPHMVGRMEEQGLETEAGAPNDKRRYLVGLATGKENISGMGPSRVDLRGDEEADALADEGVAKRGVRLKTDTSEKKAAANWTQVTLQTPEPEIQNRIRPKLGTNPDPPNPPQGRQPQH